AAEYGNYPFFSELMSRLKYILKAVGRMGIIYYYRYSKGVWHGLESSGHSLIEGKAADYIIHRHSVHKAGSDGSKGIIYTEPSRYVELYRILLSIVVKSIAYSLSRYGYILRSQVGVFAVNSGRSEEHTSE